MAWPYDKPQESRTKPSPQDMKSLTRCTTCVALVTRIETRHGRKVTTQDAEEMFEAFRKLTLAELDKKITQLRGRLAVTPSPTPVSNSLELGFD